MKEYITEQQFLVRQPSYPKRTATTDYYRQLANLMVGAAFGRKLTEGLPESVVARAAMCVTGYFQDIVCDSGIWRSFIECHHKFYGRWLPFFNTGDDYIPHELNVEDVRFLVWYAVVMNYENRRLEYPLDSVLMKLADLWHAMLDKIYEDAPEPEDFFFWRGLEVNNSEDQEEVYHFSHWLYMHCYLTTPAFALTLADIVNVPEIRDKHDMAALQAKLDDAMAEIPTGPMALYLVEWLNMILGGKFPKEEDKQEQWNGDKPHPTYEKFVAANGGSPIALFPDYESLNRFLIEKLGWTAGEDHLVQLKESGDFVLMVNPGKGMLVAHDICKCLDLPGNAMYDREYARRHSIELLTERGCCPIDLLKYLWSVDALPDAVFSGSDDHELVEANRDFIARCYLQQYYRGD